MDQSALSIPATMSTSEITVPSKAHAGDAGFDLRATERIVLQPFERALIPTGLSIALPEGYAGFVMPRSGTALRNGLSIVNTPGLIDSGYRGEIKVIAINLDAHTALTIEKGDRIAQLVVMGVPASQLKLVSQLPSSDRGAAGFGSTGVK
ncbi:MAG: dUTP diphosphatase [Eggerthellaceae bacterium]|jgi:dUTP pyrophosphatase|nr:dUTP diphosphatase [Eggerthellaceae bacterium]MCH4220609.1 dUTP diphosphatase [Eggerthellaceae bacterium]